MGFVPEPAWASVRFLCAPWMPTARVCFPVRNGRITLGGRRASSIVILFIKRLAVFPAYRCSVTAGWYYIIMCLQSVCAYVYTHIIIYKYR